MDDAKSMSSIQDNSYSHSSDEGKNKLQEEVIESNALRKEDQEQENIKDSNDTQKEICRVAHSRKRKLLPFVKKCTVPLKRTCLEKVQTENVHVSSIDKEGNENLTLLCKAISLSNDSNENFASSPLYDSEKICVAHTSDTCNTKARRTSTNLKKRRKQNVEHEALNSSEIECILDDLGDDIDNILESTAQKKKLTVANVKCILRHVITNEYVLAMVRNTMKSDANQADELEEAMYEPILTRSRAKVLRENKAQLPWPVCSPVKQPTNILLEEEFSDEEGSSDEEYSPTKEELQPHVKSVSEKSEKDSAESGSSMEGSNSETNSQIGEESSEEGEENVSFTSMNESIPETVMSPKEPIESELMELPILTVVEPSVITDIGEMSPVINHSDEFFGQVSNADKVASRTRSKMPLTDTPLELLEASFIAPDITTDMYDTEFDDEEWKKFLLDLVNPSDVQMVSEPADDEKDDPEYRFLEDDDILDDWDLRNDKAVKISQKELNMLMEEILEAAEKELGSEVEEDQEDESEFVLQPLNFSHGQQNIATNAFEQLAYFFSKEEKLQLHEQMRMHVQLLCQMFLLSRDNMQYETYGDHAKVLLEELQSFSKRGAHDGSTSNFKAENLAYAIKIVHSYSSYKPIEVKRRPKDNVIQCNRVKKTLAYGKAFIYPDLLPTVRFFKLSEVQKKVTFTFAEDNLICLGLEQFSCMKHRVRLLHEYLMPVKTEQQIKFRIKNMKRCVLPPNPIQFYFLHKMTPYFKRECRPFDPKQRKVPSDFPPEALPAWMASYCVKSYALITPKEKTKCRPVKNVSAKKSPEKCNFSPILPRYSTQGNHRSPMKKIIPILRKYGQHRRAVILSPSPIKKLPNLVKKSPAKIMPKIDHLISESQKNLSPEVSKRLSIESYNSIPSTEASIARPNACENTLTDKSISKCTAATIQSSPRQTRQRTLKSKEQTNSCDQNTYIAESSSPCADDVTNIDTGNENDSKTEMEASEDGEEELLDDEQDLAALMVASSTICKKQSHPVIRKKNKHQKDLESTLALLTPDLMESDPKKSERENVFVKSYLLRVSEALKNEPDKLDNFFQILCNFEYKNETVVDLYKGIKKILEGHPALVEDFVGFLLPEQAKDCGKYVEYLTLSKIRSFFRKIEVHFSQQPQQIQKILRALTQLHQQSNLTSETVIRTLQPLFRNQSHLMEELSQLLPNEPPLECMMTDFEEITIPGSGTENTSDDSVEDIIIPETVDPYGCQDCPCYCHSETSDIRMQNRSRHCVKCGTKFLDGKVYIQTGKFLKPAQVIYHDATHSVSQAKSPTIASHKDNIRKESCENHSTLSISMSSPHRAQTMDSEKHDAEPDKVHSFATSDSSSQETTSCMFQKANIQVPSTKSLLTSSTSMCNTNIASNSQSESPTFFNRHSNKLSLNQTDISSLNKDALSKAAIQNNLQNHQENISVGTVPVDVIENALLPPDTSNKSPCLPSDFSHIKDVISPSSTSLIAASDSISDFLCFNSNFKETPSIEQQNMNSELLKDQSPLQVIVNPSKFHLSSSSQEVKNLNTTSFGAMDQCNDKCNPTKLKWTRDQDKLILETCQKYGVSDESFSLLANTIGDRTSQQIKGRFDNLLSLYKEKVLAISSSEESDASINK